jgi:hypothetical protein
MAPSVDTAAAAVPARTHEQRMRALKGERDPLEAAQLKRDLKAGKARVESLLLDPPIRHVGEGLRHDAGGPEVRPREGNKILTQCRISPSKTIGGLSQRQRGELVGRWRPGPNAPSANRRWAVRGSPAIAGQESAGDRALPACSTQARRSRRAAS